MHTMPDTLNVEFMSPARILCQENVCGIYTESVCLFVVFWVFFFFHMVINDDMTL